MGSYCSSTTCGGDASGERFVYVTYDWHTGNTTYSCSC